LIDVGVIIGNYQILEEVGIGGMGKVYRGLDMMLDREVAIKVLRPELTKHQSLVERFRNEAMVLARLSHPHIAMLYNLIHQDHLLFMVMEFVRGETLDLRIRESGALPYDQAIRFFGQISEAIGYAHHHGVIHRDLKPGNIMITPESGVKVMDFGIARVLGTDRMTREGSVIGTLEYMAPEQIRGHELSERTDIYSLGILLYEMLVGQLPFSSDNQYELMQAHIETPPPPPRSFAPHLPEYVEQAILRALAKNPYERFDTVMEFRQILIGNDHSPVTGFQTGPLREAAVREHSSETGQTRFDNERKDEVEEIAAQHDPSGTTALSEDALREPQKSTESNFPYSPEKGSSRHPLLLIIGGILVFVVALVVFFIARQNGNPPPKPAPPKSSSEMIRITGGNFRMGRDYGERDGEDLTWAVFQMPAHEVTVQSFEIDRTEVSNEEYARFINESDHPSPADWVGKMPIKGQEKWPVRYVSLDDARAFAEWRSKRDGVTYRLPTEIEWEFAAKGQTDYHYPWGNTWSDDRANLETLTPKPVGSYLKGASPFGVLDLIGNVSEWTSSQSRIYPGNTRSAVASPGTGSEYIIRGGSYVDSPSGRYPISVTGRDLVGPSHKASTLGFRLVRPVL
jgi:serine/threonine-protein kinase